MKITEEIGGYFALECYGHSSYHNGAIVLNSARNALRYIVRAYKIEEILVPYYTCPVVWQALQSENCKIVPYDLDQNFMPALDFNKDSYILYTNYFGVCGKNVKVLAERYPYLIVDNSQAFFAKKQGIASFYSPRKFFGLPDGGLALCEKKCNDTFDVAISFQDYNKHNEKHKYFIYDDLVMNDKAIIDQPIKYMSTLTKALISKINYENVRQKRLQNFNILHEVLKTKNALKLDLASDDVPFKYPFFAIDKTIRDNLIKNNIIIYKYWEIEYGCNCMRSVSSLKLKNNLLTLPIDQRYNETDMNFILDVIGR